jgi:hypothetical protein
VGRLSVVENFGDFFDRVPIACGDGHTQALLYLGESLTEVIHSSAPFTAEDIGAIRRVAIHGDSNQRQSSSEIVSGDERFPISFVRRRELEEALSRICARWRRRNPFRGELC